jgi:hypothetical protein
MGQLANDIRQLLAPETAKAWTKELQVIDRAIKIRNHVTHSPVRIGSSWRDYSTAGGEWVAVISTMGDKEYDEHDLRQDLALQQEAIEAAVRVLHSTHPDTAERIMVPNRSLRIRTEYALSPAARNYGHIADR